MVRKIYFHYSPPSYSLSSLEEPFWKKFLEDKIIILGGESDWGDFYWTVLRLHSSSPLVLEISPAGGPSAHRVLMKEKLLTLDALVLWKQLFKGLGLTRYQYTMEPVKEFNWKDEGKFNLPVENSSVILDELKASFCSQFPVEEINLESQKTSRSVYVRCSQPVSFLAYARLVAWIIQENDRTEVHEGKPIFQILWEANKDHLFVRF